MAFKQIFPLLKLAALLVVSSALTGCLFLHDDYETSGSRSRGIPLSQAMKSSASGSREPLHGSGGWEKDTSVDTRTDYTSVNTSADHTSVNTNTNVKTGMVSTNNPTAPSSGDAQSPSFNSTWSQAQSILTADTGPSTNNTRSPGFESMWAEMQSIIDADSNTLVRAKADLASSSTNKHAKKTGLYEKMIEPAFRLSLQPYAEYSLPLNGQFKEIGRCGLQLNVEFDRCALGVYASADGLEMRSGTPAADAVNDVGLLEFGVLGRFYLLPAEDFVCPYLSANMSAQLLLWHYRNPVYVGSKEINYDSLQALGGYVGFGVVFWRRSHFNLYVEAGVGGTAFLSETDEGFHNDVFNDFGYFSVRGGLAFKF